MLSYIKKLQNLKQGQTVNRIIHQEIKKGLWKRKQCFWSWSNKMVGTFYILGGVGNLPLGKHTVVSFSWSKDV